MHTWTRRIYSVVALLVASVLLVPNLRLYHAPPADRDQPDPDALRQLRFIRGALDQGAAGDMQALFPEGSFFTHVLYGLSWINIGLQPNISAEQRDQAISEARWTLDQIDTPAERAPFSPQLDPPYGVFYVGWSSWLRGGLLMLQASDRRDPALEARFVADTAALAAAFERSPTPFLAAYPAQAWPVDSVVAVASLRLHDAIVAPRYSATITRWLGAAQARVDPATGLLPHRVDAMRGDLVDGARGSSQSIIARFLIEIDPRWGDDQYRRFRDQFVATPLGVPGIREYPHGVAGSGDVDSGPLIFGLSASATAVMLGAAYVHNDRAFATPVEQVAEAVGAPIRWNGTTRYLFGVLPVADAFLVWSRTAQPWIAPLPSSTNGPIVAWWWRWPFHLISLGVIGLVWLPLRLVRSRRRSHPRVAA